MFPICRELIAAAQRQRIDALTDLGGRNTLLYYKDRRAGTLDLASADPDVLEQFEKTGRARLTKLFTDADEPEPRSFAEPAATAEPAPAGEPPLAAEPPRPVDRPTSAPPVTGAVRVPIALPARTVTPVKGPPPSRALPPIPRP